MGCRQGQTSAGIAGGRTAPARQAAREVISRLFLAGRQEAAARHRLEICLHASPCGRPCRWFVKGPGATLAWCSHPRLPEPLRLYPALRDEAFACPEGFW